MNAHKLVQKILSGKSTQASRSLATCFAPTNIALIKYWGKRHSALNLPMTNSLSIALPNKGSRSTLSINHLGKDCYFLNGQEVEENTEFYRRLHDFCDFFRFKENYSFTIHTINNIPTAAGLASSASGFAALVLAFDQLFDWQLDKSNLSILARLGSGSACRSLWNGIVEWEKGNRDDGLDSFAFPYALDQDFLDSLCVGLLIFDKEKKIISSRQAMLNTVNTSVSYKQWPQQVEQDLSAIKIALEKQDFNTVGLIAERNALAMHATMADSHPSTNYCIEKTYAYREKIWALRKKGLAIYFTQDAGPNLKILFMRSLLKEVQEAFPESEIILR